MQQIVVWCDVGNMKHCNVSKNESHSQINIFFHKRHPQKISTVCCKLNRLINSQSKNGITYFAVVKTKAATGGGL